MAFWGVEVKPGKPFSHQFDQSRGRLHISQATLGIGSSSKKGLVQCNVGDKSPILLCSLIPEKTESCVLDLEFEEMDEVIFSVIGPRSVHLTGYYIGNDASACGHEGHEDDSDSYGEDIGETESDESSDYDDDGIGIEYDDDFIDDDDDDMEMFDPSPKRKSGVVIEEIIHDNDKPANENGDPKAPKKKYQVSDPDDNQGQIILKGSTSMWDSETSEDEDGLPKSKAEDGNAEVLNKSDKKVGKGKKKKAKDNAPEQVKGISESESEDEDGLPKSSTSDKKVAKGKKKKAEKGAKQLTGAKRKIESVTERGVEEQNDSSIPSTEPNKKKKKKKERTKKGKTLGDGDNHKSDSNKDSEGQIEDAKIDNIEKDQQDGDKKLPNDECPDIDAKTPGSEDQTDGKKKKKKKKKKKNKVPESNENVSKDGEKKGSIAEIAVEKAEVKPSQARSYSNGLAVEELEMGKPDGKRASPGKKVFVRYIGKLKSNGKIFDSNVRGPPFKFRLGVGEVIKGWDVGVNGMRVGDKRRITVPPAMGYGTKGAGGQIPPNAWLVFDVELVDVR